MTNYTFTFFIAVIQFLAITSSIIIFILLVKLSGDRPRRRRPNRRNSNRSHSSPKSRNESDLNTYSNYPYRTIESEKGYYGERLICRELESINTYHRMLSNLYIPTKDGYTTEIDMVYLHQTGIYVIESKYYSGYIRGTEDDTNWTQVFSRKNKKTFYNPVRQNASHIRHLKHILYEIDQSDFTSLIVFSDKCSIEQISIYSDKIKVITQRQLKHTLASMFWGAPAKFTPEEIDILYEILYPYTVVSDDVKLNHEYYVQEIKRKSS